MESPRNWALQLSMSNDKSGSLIVEMKSPRYRALQHHLRQFRSGLFLGRKGKPEKLGIATFCLCTTCDQLK